MADLFGEDSGSETDATDTFKPAQLPGTNGDGGEVNGEGEDLWGGPPTNGSDALPPRYGGEEEEEEEGRGPRDDINVSVVEYQKSGDDYKFDVEVEVNGKKSTLHRNYKELLWLHRNLARKVELGGNILPPMPPPPPNKVDPRVVIFGTHSRALYGDHTRISCLGVETFLQALSNHRFFSENNTVHTYLVEDQVNVEEKLGTGSLWSSFTKTISDFKIGGIQDSEEEFTKFLKTVDELAPKLQDAAKAFGNLVASQQGMAVAEFLLSEMFWEHSNWSSGKNSCSVLLDKLATAVQEEKEYFVASSFDGRHTLGFTFELYHLYCMQAKEMLYRRLGKLQTLHSCNATLDKAKPEKKAAAEAAKEDADRAFKAISETAKREIEVYVDGYTSAFRDSLTAYAQAEIHHSKQTYNNIARLRDELDRVDVA